MEKLKNSGTIKRATSAFNSKDTNRDGAVINQQTNVGAAYRDLRISTHAVKMRGLTQYIADLRACRIRELEEKRINRELAHIRQRFKGRCVARRGSNLTCTRRREYDRLPEAQIRR